MSDFHATHTTTTATTTTTGTASSRVWLDLNYIRSTNGILKLVQIVLAFATFIASVTCHDYAWRAGWAAFVSFWGCFLTCVWLFLYIFHIIDVSPRIPWPFVEFVYYCLFTFLFFIAGIVMALLASLFGEAAAILGTIFCFLSMIAFGLDLFLKFQTMRGITGGGSIA